MMKKLILPLLCLLLLSGCGESDASLELSTPTGTVRGTYAGGEEDGLPQGEGVFTSENGWVFEGSFAAGAFGAGSVSNYPAPNFNGSYTGAVDALVPQGKGRLVSETGRFDGSFEAGLPHTGSAENYPCIVSFSDERIEGLYTGALEAGLPQGEGSFTATIPGRSLSYEGSFAAGSAAGEGVLSDDGFMLDGQRGLYEGSVLDGKPHGKGSLTARTVENIDFTYTGEWADGLYDGEGELIYDSALYYERRGRFTEGEFTPDPFELLAALGSREPFFHLNATQEAFIAEYPELMDAAREVPHYMTADYRFLWDQTLTYAKYMEDPSLYEEEWLLFYNYVILQSREVELADGSPCTIILACNTLYKEPAVFYLFGESGNLTSLRYMTAYGIALGTTHYTSATGEQLEAVAALLGSAGGY